MMFKSAIASGFLACIVSTPVVAAPSFVVKPVGQALSNTCQSYALGVALAFKQDPAFKIETAAQLRAAELAIRAQIKSAAGAEPVNHEHVKKGFEAFTGGAYKLAFNDVSVADVGEQAGTRSGVTSKAALPPTFLLGVVVKDVVLASATRIGSDSYGSGHIFTVLGRDGPPNSDQKLLVLNSAVKVKDTEKNMCTDGVPDAPEPYTAELSWMLNSNITFRLFGGKVRLWTIEKS